jgi:hypothetical protein
MLPSGTTDELEVTVMGYGGSNGIEEHVEEVERSEGDIREG